MVIRSEAAIRELSDRVKEMLVHKEVLQFAAAAMMTYQDSDSNKNSNKDEDRNKDKNSQSIKNDGRLSLEITKDTLSWVLTEKDSFLNKFSQSAANSYETPELEQNDLILRN